MAGRWGKPRDRSAGLLEQRKRTDQRRPEIRNDDVDLVILGDFGRQNFLRQRRIPVRHVEGLGVEELVFGSKHGLQPRKLVETLAVARRAAQEQKVAALRQYALDPVAPVLAVILEIGTDKLGVVRVGLTPSFDAVRYNDFARLVDAGYRGQHGLSGVREDNEGIDAFSCHGLNVRNRLLSVALAVSIFVIRDTGALEGFLLAGSGRHLAPAVAAIAVEQSNCRFLRAAPRRRFGLSQIGAPKGDGCRRRGER